MLNRDQSKTMWQPTNAIIEILFVCILAHTSPLILGWLGSPIMSPNLIYWWSSVRIEVENEENCMQPLVKSIQLSTFKRSHLTFCCLKFEPEVGPTQVIQVEQINIVFQLINVTWISGESSPFWFLIFQFWPDQIADLEAWDRALQVGHTCFNFFCSNNF